ncbi:protein iq-domain 1 [Phtheirospermum japonicum]|uniref:Protein iq-domain 1 n=1 Tax=Phtheirospermum japonicum TaxID=374723 RepID=A0A830BEA4_9LAMI|nr:protein iq-domain 1 [Phtheirospermum japonicum]
MVRKGNWFSSVKKALSPDTKEKKAKKASKLKKRWFGKEKPPVVSESPNREIETVQVSHPHPLPPLEDVKLTAEVENEETKHAYDVAVASAAAAEAAVAAAQAAAEVVRLTTVSQFAGKSNEEIAAIKIQTAFRGYLARRALRALRGLVRLKSLVDGPTVKRQTSNTLKCMQTLSRVQSQIQSRRLRMLEENRALQRQLLQKRAKELESLRVGEEWDDSLQSKEKIESNLLHKYEAAMRRERALAYSYTHQQTWKKSAKSTNLLFMDPTNPHWGWSWLERWMAARPWETQATTADKDSNSSIKSPGGEITKSFARHQLNSDNNPSSPSSQKPPSPFTPSKSTSSVISKKIKPASPKGSAISQDDDSRSTFSVQSELRSNRRHTIGGGSSVRDDESLGSSSSVPSYMATTRSARAKLKLLSPLGMENGGGNNNNNNMMPDKGSVKKRLSFPASPARPPRRHSGPPKVETNLVGENGTVNETIIA